MKLRLFQFLAIIGTFMLGTFAVHAKDKTEVVTGCLAKGAHAHEYTLTSADGKTWDLTNPGTVKMSNHVGQKVTVTGQVTKAHKMKETSSSTSTGTTTTTNTGMMGDHLRVNDIQMVSSSCQ